MRVFVFVYLIDEGEHTQGQHRLAIVSPTGYSAPGDCGTSLKSNASCESSGCAVSGKLASKRSEEVCTVRRKQVEADSKLQDLRQLVLPLNMVR
ncbi:hypothetical protein RRG08_012400 [Elysia crispata]|uniref:Uncharacterized protein n=1 Tax=Elysia crispata TaxID=231223 RepID=A0AAE1D065_9GAST|nr:hypothetical protein RRG08_012400 [Elysia crispata]